MWTSSDRKDASGRLLSAHSRSRFPSPARSQAPARSGQLTVFPLQCSYNAAMVAITIRGIPNDVRDELASRAARAGKSLQEYLRGVLVASTARPTSDDLIARARARVEATNVQMPAEAILAARDADRW
jgi:antitoxin FitA